VRPEAADGDIPHLIKHLQQNPSELARLSGLSFERVIAELLASFGWRVSLTPPSRDGGIDILAITSDPSGFETSWIVECKRYGVDRPVGVSAVRQLYGVQQSLGIPRAVLVTTSRLSADAALFIQRTHGLSIADSSVLRRWLDGYVEPTDRATHTSGKHFVSCFLSYSHRDEAFASTLASRLREEGVEVWYAADNIRPGEKIHESVLNAIEQFDRLIVVLSRDAIASPWVQSEIRRARRREVRDQVRMLFPVSLMPFSELQDWELFDADLGQDLARELREYLIPDFADWRNPTAFDHQVRSLLSGLAAPRPDG
jgi:hypothetical protein